jgi:alpha-beta hydrolase superfamily lysophospholipase
MMAIAGGGISYKVWASASPRAKLLLIHGLGANSSWWESFASQSLKNGFSSYAIDLRENQSFAEFFDSINNLIIKIKADNPGKKIFAVGESMGALIILSMALKDQAIFDGLICIAPAFNSKMPLKLPDYLRIFLPIFYDRNRRHKLPVSSDMCTRDPVYLKMIEATYYKDVMSTSQALFDIFVTQLRMRLLRMRIESPLLFLIAGHDLLVYPEASVKVFGRLRCEDKTLIEYPGMYHALSIELGKEKVFQDIWSWIDKRI